MNMKLIYILAMLFPFMANSANKDEIRQFDAQVDSIFSAVYFDANQPGAAVLIMKDWKIVSNHCYGIADIETQIPVTNNTNFCIASVSKQFAAVAILQLAQQGKLSLNDPISKFFPEFKAPFFNTITLHHILSHTSGIPDARLRNDRNFVLYSTDVESVGYMKTLNHLNFTPGTQYEYINPTYQLIYQIVERVSGLPFEQYMKKNVFSRAGMKHTIYFEPDRDIKHLAHGYAWDEDNHKYAEYDYGEESFFATKADGALYSSINDFVKWEKALAKLKVWNVASRQMAYSRKVTIPSDAEYGYQPYTGYGYGFFIQAMPGRCPVVYHTGDNGGFTIYAGKVPLHNVVFLFFSTRNDIDRMKLVNAVYEKMEPLGWLRP